MLETPPTRASRRAAALPGALPAAAPVSRAAADVADGTTRPRRRIALLGGAAALGVALSVGAFQAPAAIAALTSAPTSEQILAGDDAAETAGIALTDAVALNNVVRASDLAVDAPVVDITSLRGDVKALRDPSALTSDLLTELTGSAETQTREVRAETAALQDALTEAKDAEAARVQAEKEAAEAAAKEAAEAARLQAEKEAAAALAAANTVDGAKTTARDMAASRYGWGADQFSCLQSLWTKESGWNYQAYNAGSGATGIPQSLPGSKMATAGADWQTSAATQISWGLDYIKRAYGTPCSAWGHSQATDWY